MSTTEKFPHYYKNVEDLKEIDVYRVLQLFNVTNPCVQHAVKKLLVTGARGTKDQSMDIAEAIASLCRWQEMYTEDNPQPVVTTLTPEQSKQEVENYILRTAPANVIVEEVTKDDHIGLLNKINNLYKQVAK